MISINDKVEGLNFCGLVFNQPSLNSQEVGSTCVNRAYGFCVYETKKNDESPLSNFEWSSDTSGNLLLDKRVLEIRC